MKSREYQTIIGEVRSTYLENRPKYHHNIQQSYGFGSTVGVMLPFSRNHEAEADKIGLTLMTIAGYDPMEAAYLWERMAQVGGAAPPEILSTHPSNQTRIQKIIQWVPEAKREAAKYK